MVTSTATVLRALLHPASEHADASRATEERLRRGRTQTDDELGLDRRELELEPVPARLDLRPVGLVVDPPLPRRSPLEVLDGIRHVDAALVDPGLGKELGEAASRPGRRTACPRGPRASPGCSPTSTSRASPGPRRTPSGSRARTAGSENR